MATNFMNQIDELFVVVKYGIPPEEELYSFVKTLPLDFLISLGYVSEETTDASEAFLLRPYYRSWIISDLIVYEKLMAP